MIRAEDLDVPLVNSMPTTFMWNLNAKHEHCNCSTTSASGRDYYNYILNNDVFHPPLLDLVTVTKTDSFPSKTLHARKICKQ